MAGSGNVRTGSDTLCDASAFEYEADTCNVAKNGVISEVGGGGGDCEGKDRLYLKCVVGCRLQTIDNFLKNKSRVSMTFDRRMTRM